MALPYTNIQLNQLVCTIPSTVANFNLGFPNELRIYNGKIVTTMVMENNTRTKITGYIVIIIDPVSKFYNIYKTPGIDASTDRSFQNTFGIFNGIDVDTLVVYPISTNTIFRFEIPPFIYANVIAQYNTNATGNSVLSSCTTSYPAAMGFNVSTNEILREDGNSQCMKYDAFTGAISSDFYGPSTYNYNIQFGNTGQGSSGADAYCSLINKRLLTFDTNGNAYSVSSDYTHWPNGIVCPPTTQPIQPGVLTTSAKIYTTEVADVFYANEIDNNLFAFAHAPASNWFIFTSLFLGVQVAFRSSQQNNVPLGAYVNGHIYIPIRSGSNLNIWTEDPATPVVIPNYTPNYTQSIYDFASPPVPKNIQIDYHNYLINLSRPVSAIGAYKS